MDSQEAEWMNETNIGDDLMNFKFFPTLETESTQLDTCATNANVPNTTGGPIFELPEIEPETIDDIFKEKDPAISQKPTETDNLPDYSWMENLIGLTAQDSGEVDVELQIQEALLSQLPSSSNDMLMVSPSNINPYKIEDTILEPPTQQLPAKSGRRKTQQVYRTASDSPYAIHIEEEIMTDIVVTEKKPDINALSIVNGASSVRGRKRVNSSESTGSQKKPRRKYEIDDPQDTSVKNAKAAKLNRDRKKKEMQDLKEKVDRISKENEALEKKVAALSVANADAEERYQKEKERNLINNGLVGQLTNAKKILELIVPPLVSNLGPMTVSVSDAFESIPVRTDEHGNILLSEAVATSDGNYIGVDSLSTYTTFHISPQERNIKVDYDPHY